MEHVQTNAITEEQKPFLCITELRCSMTRSKVKDRQETQRTQRDVVSQSKGKVILCDAQSLSD